MRYELGKYVHPESSKACSLAVYSIFNHFISHYDPNGNELGPNDIKKQREANKLLPKNENSGRSLRYNNQRNSDRRTLNRNYQRTRSNPSRNQVLNCEQTAVCDITINNPLKEAFRVVIHPMAEVRFIESIRNGTHVNVDSIQPSSIWLSPQSQKNRVSFLCLSGGIEKGSQFELQIK